MKEDEFILWKAMSKTSLDAIRSDNLKYNKILYRVADLKNFHKQTTEFYKPSFVLIAVLLMTQHFILTRHRLQFVKIDTFFHIK